MAWWEAQTPSRGREDAHAPYDTCSPTLVARAPFPGSRCVSGAFTVRPGSDEAEVGVVGGITS